MIKLGKKRKRSKVLKIICCILLLALCVTTLYCIYNECSSPADAFASGVICKILYIGVIPSEEVRENVEDEDDSD